MTHSGLYFEDFVLDKVYVTAARKIELHELDAFADLEGGRNAMHLDPEYAKQTIWGRMSVHGMLIVSMASGLMEGSGFFAGTGLAFLDLSWQFRAAVFVDEIRVRWSVTDKRLTSRPGRGIITRTVEVLNQDDVVVCTGQIKTMMATRD
jgi:acyl dehydratase